MRDDPEFSTGYTETVGIEPKLFSFCFHICHSVFHFSVPFSHLSENTKSIGINVEIGAERNGPYISIHAAVLWA